MPRSWRKPKTACACVEQKLSNEKFVSRAPEAVVNAEREKAAKYKELIAKLEGIRQGHAGVSPG